MRCGFCQTELIKEIRLADILFFQKVIFNECCPGCFEEIDLYNNNYLHSCQYCLKKIKKGGSVCEDCQYWLKEIKNFNLKHDYLFEYNEKMKEYFQRFKFSGDIQMGKVFQKDLYDKLSFYIKQEFLIIPIPLSSQRMAERGFNQVEVLLQNSHINYKNILLKNKESKAQSQKNRKERLCSEQPFCLKKGGVRVIQNKKVLLIDDVYTTGRTILHAYQCILEAKPSEIVSFSLTR